MVECVIVVENKWCVQCYGIDCIFVLREGLVMILEMLFCMIDVIVVDVDVFGCVVEIEYCCVIVDCGSLVDFQFCVYCDNVDDFIVVL